MLNLVAIKALAGYSYIRVDQVIAIREGDTGKSTVFMTGGVTIPCYESAKDVIAKFAAASQSEPPSPPQKEGHFHGDASE